MLGGIIINQFVCENPQEFKDEERWFKFFNMHAFKWLVATAAFWVFLVKVLGLGIIGHLIGASECIFLTAINTFERPGIDYMKGGKMLIFNFLLRKIYRNKHKEIAVKHMKKEIKIYRNKHKEIAVKHMKKEIR